MRARRGGMGRWLKGLAVVLAAGVVAAMVLEIGGRVRTNREVDRQVQDVVAAARPPATGPITDADLANLPDPVQRWLRWAGVVGREPAAIVRLEQTGTFRLREDQRWMPFSATQTYSVEPPAFVWSVTMRMLPGVQIRGFDRFSGGEGRIEMRLLGLVPVAADRGGGLDQGAALRFLNEIVWFPTAALHPAIAWEAIDDRSARAVFTHAGRSVEAIFVFDEDGRVVDMIADRFNDERDQILPWRTPMTAWGEFDGIRMPVAGTGVWEYDTGDFEYIRLEIRSVTFETLP